MGSTFNVGQARVVANPQTFMQATAVRLHVISADPTFHANRMASQDELTRLLDVILREPALRKRAAKGIYGGSLPEWWTAEDQREVRARMRKETLTKAASTEGDASSSKDEERDTDAMDA